VECFRIDESGFTGHDLLNANQPFQGAASIAIGDDDAARLIKQHFPRSQASELKFSSLVRRNSNHPRIIAIIRDVLAESKSVTFLCNKKYLLILMFLDDAVEPFYYERGLDFYENGHNYVAASMLYHAGAKVLGENAFDTLLVSFQRAAKEKTPEALNALLHAARQTRWHQIPELLGPLAKYAAPECLEAIARPSVTTDAALVVLQAIISRMEAMTDDTYRVEHDQSKNLLRYNALLNKMINHVNEIDFKVTGITNFKFPIKLCEVAQVNSRKSAAVQLADIVIGSAVHAANQMIGKRKSGIAYQDIFSLYSDDQFIFLAPSINLEEERRFRQGSEAGKMINYVARYFGNG